MHLKPVGFRERINGLLAILYLLTLAKDETRVNQSWLSNTCTVPTLACVIPPVCSSLSADSVKQTLESFSGFSNGFYFNQGKKSLRKASTWNQCMLRSEKKRAIF